jgi:hypothetical protein
MMMKYILLILFLVLSICSCDSDKFKNLVRTYKVETVAQVDSILTDTLSYSSFDTMYHGNIKNLEYLYEIDKAIKSNWVSNYRDILYGEDVIIAYDTTYHVNDRNGKLIEYNITTKNPSFMYYGYFSPVYGTVYWKSLDGYDKIRLIKTFSIENGDARDLINIQSFIDSLRDVHFKGKYPDFDSIKTDEIEHDIDVDIN